MMGDVPPHAFEGRSDQLRTEGVSWTDPIEGRPTNLHSAPTLRRESHHRRRGLRLARGHMSSISGDRLSHTSRGIRRRGRGKALDSCEGDRLRRISRTKSRVCDPSGGGAARPSRPPAKTSQYSRQYWLERGPFCAFRG